jgi:hypothetical protein
MALPSNSKTQLKRVSKGKPFSLLGLVINDEGKKTFITLLPDLRVSCDNMLSGLCRKLRLYGVDCIAPEQTQPFLVGLACLWFST